MHDDPYIAEDVIGTGPSGKVYRGHDIAGSSLVRIKALLTRNEIPCVVDRECLRALMPSLLTLRHPQICGVIALDEHGDDLALVTDLSVGEPLPFLMTQRGFNPMDVRALASQLVTALQTGEALGLHHGDVKPSNVIIADHPGGGCTLQLQDWGLAACRHEQPNETLAYRAPERLSGGPPSAQSDLFSVGATLATLLLGRAPVHGETPEHFFNAWAVFDPMLLRHARMDVDPAFHDWLAWLLRFDPSYRPVSAAQAQDMLVTGAMLASYIPPMMPMYQMPAMQTWTPTQTTDLPAPETTVNLGPPVPKPRPPTGALGPPKNDLKPLKKSRARIPFAIIFWLVALFGLGGFALWLKAQWGPEWPQHLRRVIVERMGGSVESESEPAAIIAAAKPKPIMGRFVRIELGGKTTLNLAEVEVFSMGRNIAREGKATAVNTAWGGQAKLANDGRTDGNWKKKSIFHSKDNIDTPWWEVDLAREQVIDAIKVWNRTDGDFAARLNNYSVVVLDAGRREVWRIDKQPTPKPSTRHELRN